MDGTTTTTTSSEENVATFTSLQALNSAPTGGIIHGNASLKKVTRSNARISPLEDLRTLPIADQ